jgi:hypothetical protein
MFVSLPGDGEAGELTDGEESLGPAAPGWLRAPPHLHLQPQAVGGGAGCGTMFLSLPGDGEAGQLSDGEEGLGPAAPGRLRTTPHLHLQPQAARLTLTGSRALAIPTRGKERVSNSRGEIRSVFRIRINLIRIRIQHFRRNSLPIRIRIQFFRE